MKSLNKKISVVVLSGALLIGGLVASSKIYVYANNDDLNALCYKYGFHVIDENYNEEDNIQEDIFNLGKYYGVGDFSQIKYMKYNEFKLKLENRGIDKGIKECI